MHLLCNHDDKIQLDIHEATLRKYGTELVVFSNHSIEHSIPKEVVSYFGSCPINGAMLS